MAFIQNFSNPGDGGKTVRPRSREVYPRAAYTADATRGKKPKAKPRPMRPELLKFCAALCPEVA